MKLAYLTRSEEIATSGRPRESGDPGAASGLAGHPRDPRFRGDDKEGAVVWKRFFMRFAVAAVLLLVGFESSIAQQPLPLPQFGEAPLMGQPERSLLFSPDEVAAVRRAIANLTGASLPDAAPANDAAAAPKPTQSNIFLSALVDFGDGQWTVWANGYRINPEHQPPGFRVVSVKENKVEIVTEGEQPTRFQLRPYQTWRAAQHDIVEGIVP